MGNVHIFAGFQASGELSWHYCLFESGVLSQVPTFGSDGFNIYKNSVVST